MFRSRVSLFRSLIRYVRTVSIIFSLSFFLIFLLAFLLLFYFILLPVSWPSITSSSFKFSFFFIFKSYLYTTTFYAISFSLLAAVVQASNCGPSLLALLHGTMISASIAAIQHSQRDTSRKTIAPSHTSHNHPNSNSTFNKGKGNSSNNGDIGSVYRNGREASPLTRLLTSSRFSSNDAHSLPPLIREVSGQLTPLLFTVYYLYIVFFFVVDCSS